VFDACSCCPEATMLQFASTLSADDQIDDYFCIPKGTMPHDNPIGTKAMELASYLDIPKQVKTPHGDAV
jgi:hypothetical protein